MTPKKPNLARYGDYLGLGIQIAASMVMPLLAGVWLDKRYATTPWFTLAGALFGIFSIFGIVLKIAYTANQSTPGKKNDAQSKQ